MNENNQQNWVQIPTQQASQEDWARFFNALGRPKEVSGYQFNASPDAFYDATLAEHFKTLAHQAGLTPQQATILHDGMVQILNQKAQEQQNSAQTQKQSIMQNIKQKWGANYADKLKKAQNAARYFAFKDAEINDLENIIGSEAVLDGLLRIGEGMAQDTALMDIQPQTTMLSADSAKQKRAELSRDASFLEALMDKAHPGHGAALNEINRLNQIITG